MTTEELLLECYRRLNFTATPTATVTARLLGFLNDAHRRLLTSPGMELLRDRSVRFQTVPGQSRVALPPDIAQVKAVTQIPVIPLPAVVTDDVEPAPLPVTTPTGSPTRLLAVRRDEYRRLDPGLTTSGDPDTYAPIGEEEVEQQPLVIPTGLWAVSSSAADTGILVRIEARILRGNYLYYNSFDGTIGTPLNGLTRVPIRTHNALLVPTEPAPTTLGSVQKFSLNTYATGYVDLWTAASGGQRLARIEPGRTSNSYFIIELEPTPTSVYVYQVDYARHVRDLHSQDLPSLPRDFHYVLALMACRREYVFSDDKARYQHMAMEEQEALRALRAWVLYPPDYRVRNVDPEEYWHDGSNLGPYFPAGRW